MAEDQQRPSHGESGLMADTLRTPLSAAPASLGSLEFGVAGRARFDDLGLLGRGGMGEVRLHRDRWLGREVALKVMRGEGPISADRRARFLREARIQGQLEHPSIVPVYDVGLDASGREYFTMRRIGGRTLRELLTAAAARAPGAPSQNKLLGVFRQLCQAMSYAHQRGVIHRDLKPENVMVGDFGEVYVLDWGIAKLLGESSEPLDAVDTLEGAGGGTLAGAVMGSPGYMAPEQIGRAAEADARTDVYALGAILYEVLALQPLHRGDTQARLASTARGVAEAPSACGREVPPELDALCLAATAGEPGKRLASAHELASAIEAYLEGDRDLDARRAAARQHAGAAREAQARMRGGAPDAAEARRAALREAGRALALDPSGQEGLRTALEVMLEPPAEIPPEVREDARAAVAAQGSVAILRGAAAFALFLGVVALLPLWVAVLRPGGLVLVAAFLAGNLLFTFLPIWLRLPPRQARPYWSLAGGLGFGAIAASAGFVSPMVLVPPLAVALVTVAIAGRTPDWRLFVALGAATFSVPFLLEWAGVLSPVLQFSPEAITIQANFIAFGETPTRVLILLGTLGALVGPAVALAGVMRRERELRSKWLLQIWHLRVMAGA